MITLKTKSREHWIETQNELLSMGFIWTCHDEPKIYLPWIQHESVKRLHEVAGFCVDGKGRLMYHSSTGSFYRKVVNSAEKFAALFVSMSINGDFSR